jgi:hypothetical protein
MIKVSFRKGMTMMEVIVMIAVFSIIMVAVTALLASSWRNHNFIMNTNSASITANQGTSKVVDIIRTARVGDNGAYPIQSAQDFDLVLFSDIDKDGVTEKIHCYIDDEKLKLGISNPIGFPLSYPASDEETRVIARRIVNNSSEPIFHYYNNTNNIISNPGANISQIKMVEINLVVERKEGDLSIESYASIRNLSDHDRIE